MEERLKQLQAENEQLQAVVKNLDQSARLLVRRDMELRRANEKLLTLDKNKSEFVSIAAHQFRTPLTGTLWAIDLILTDQDAPLTEKQKNMLTAIRQSTQRLIKIVNNLLDVGHLDIGNVDFKSSTTCIDFVSIVEKVIADQTAEATNKQIPITFTAKIKSVGALADPDRIYDVIGNLLDNAIKYTKEGGHIEVTVDTTDTDVITTITDNGIGIPESFMDRIFRKFARAYNAQEVDPNGSGLGLYIVRRVLELSGGSVSCRSKVGLGSTFTIKLPIVHCQ